jgi:hypothetical protein
MTKIQRTKMNSSSCNRCTNDGSIEHPVYLLEKIYRVYLCKSCATVMLLLDDVEWRKQHCDICYEPVTRGIRYTINYVAGTIHHNDWYCHKTVVMHICSTCKTDILDIMEDAK